MITTFIDIGAYEGGVIDQVLAARPTWKIIGFEPAKKAFEALDAKYLSVHNVDIRRNAIWKESGPHPFYVSELQDGNSMHKEKKNLVNPKATTVVCLRITDVLEALEGRRIVYMNCEGSEYEILEEALQTGAHKLSEWIVQYHGGKNRLACGNRHRRLLERLREEEVDITHLRGGQSLEKWFEEDRTTHSKEGRCPKS